MCIQYICAIGAWFAFASVAAAAPALKYSDPGDICGVTTVYVTVLSAPPIVNMVEPSQLPTATSSEQSILTSSGSIKLVKTSTAGSFAFGSSSEEATAWSVQITTTVHQTVFLTHTMTGAGVTKNETLDALSRISTSYPAEYGFPTHVGAIASTGSVDAVLISNTAEYLDSHFVTHYSTGLYTISNGTPIPVSSSPISTKTSASNGLRSHIVENGTTYGLNTPTSTPSDVTIIETLTVIPLSTLPRMVSSNSETTSLTIQSTVLSTTWATLTAELSISALHSYSSNATGISGAIAATLSSGIYHGSVSGGWSLSISSTAGFIDSLVVSSSFTGPTSSGFNTPSGGAPASLNYPLESVNFSNSNTLSIPTSSLAAQSGFTAFYTSSAASAGGQASSSLSLFSTSGGFPSLDSSFRHRPTSSAAAVSESSCSETYSPLSTVKSVESAIISTIEFSNGTSSLVVSTASSLPLNPSSYPECPSSTMSSAPSSYPSAAGYAEATSSAPLASNSTLAPSSETLVNSSLELLSTTSLGLMPSASSSLPKATLCGELSPFSLNFDDLPPLSAFDNSTAQPMPLFSPYHQFFFSDGFTVVPPPTDPYLPSSGRLLLEFLANPESDLGYTGDISNGNTNLLYCFNFNALGVSVGCDSMGPDCDWQFTGLQYNFASMVSDEVTTQHLSTPACPSLKNCPLIAIHLDNTFKNLTSLRINVTVAGEHKIWWMDDLNLAWYDDSCGAGLCRQENI